jgi:hypothetical protein
MKSRRIGKVYRLVMTNNNLTYGYLSSIAVAFLEQLISTASLTREMSGDNLSVTDSTCCINEGTLCPPHH